LDVDGYDNDGGIWSDTINAVRNLGVTLVVLVVLLCVFGGFMIWRKKNNEV